MKKAPEIRNELLEVLAEVVDERLRSAGFVRNKRSFIYSRKLNDTAQQIDFIMNSHSKFRPDADAHIHPHLLLRMPQVGEKALALVHRDRWLLPGRPEVVLSEPIELTAPKDKLMWWFATGKEEMVAVCGTIAAFIVRWVLPFLAEASTPEDLVRLHETRDERVFNDERWHICIAAAYEVLGRPDKAREVVRQRFGKPGLRKQYAALFESLGID